MPIQIDTLPGGGGMILTALATAGLALLAGQEIATREIAKINGAELCPQAIRESVERQRKPLDVIPEKRCTDAVGDIPLLPSPWRQLGNQICNEYGDPDINGPARKRQDVFNRQADALETKRLERLASNAGTQCSCAAAVFKQDYLIQLGIYAGSARLYTPPSVQNLEQSLQVSLGTPQCQALEAK